MQTEFQFEQLEFGTKFFDPISKGEYIKVSDDSAEMEDHRYYLYHDPTIQFGKNEIVIVK